MFMLGAKRGSHLLPGGGLGEVHLLELGERKVGELVMAELVGRVSGVMLLDEVIVRGKNGQPLGKLLSGLKLKAMLVDVIWIVVEV